LTAKEMLAILNVKPAIDRKADAARPDKDYVYFKGRMETYKGGEIKYMLDTVAIGVGITKHGKTNEDPKKRALYKKFQRVFEEAVNDRMHDGFTGQKTAALLEKIYTHRDE